MITLLSQAVMLLIIILFMTLIPKIEDSKGYFVQSVNGEKLFITYVKDDYGNRVYVSAVTLASVLENVKEIRIFLGALIIATFIVGILSVFILAYRSSNPIRKLINIFKQRGVSGDVKYEL